MEATQAKRALLLGPTRTVVGHCYCGCRATAGAQSAADAAFGDEAEPARGALGIVDFSAERREERWQRRVAFTGLGAYHGYDAVYLRYCRFGASEACAAVGEVEHRCPYVDHAHGKDRIEANTAEGEQPAHHGGGHPRHRAVGEQSEYISVAGERFKPGYEFLHEVGQAEEIYGAYQSDFFIRGHSWYSADAVQDVGYRDEFVAKGIGYAPGRHEAVACSGEIEYHWKCVVSVEAGVKITIKC